MTASINASTSSGVVVTSDMSGSLALQSNGTNIATVTSTGLSDGTNTISMTGIISGSAKAWVNFNGVTTATINASYNVSSVTRNATGDYTINFTNALADANYAMLGTTVSYSTSNYACTAIALKGTMASAVSLKTTTQVGVVCIVAGNNGSFDTINASVSIFR